MKIYKVIVDKKPTNCIACPFIRLRLCGKDRTVKPSSSGAYVDKVPDKRCLLKEISIKEIKRVINYG